MLVHHVGMHVRDEEIHSAVVIVVEEFDAHAAPRRSGEIIVRFFDERLAALILVIVAGALHVQEVDAGKAIALYIGESGITAPAVRIEADFRRDVFEFIVAQIFVEHWMFEALGIEMAKKCVL